MKKRNSNTKKERTSASYAGFRKLCGRTGQYGRYNYQAIADYIEDNKYKPTAQLAKEVQCSIGTINRVLKAYNYTKEYVQSKIGFKKTVDGCFEVTTLAIGSHGYPQYKERPVHKHIYNQCFGDTPKGLVVRHKCDNKLCINPEHLELGTRRDNFIDTRRTDNWTGHENHWNAKLTEEAVKYIRENNNLNENDLARKFNVNRATINDVIHYRTWPVV